MSEAEFDRTGAAFFALVHPDDRERVHATVQSAIDSRGLYECEFRVVRPGDEVAWVANRGRASYDEAGRPARVLGTITDVSARKRAEEALKASEERFRELADAVPQIVYVTDPAGKLLYLNRRWREYTGIDALDFDVCMQAMHPDDRPRLYARSVACLTAAASMVEEFRLRAADGSYRWFLTRTEAVRDAAGAVERWYGTSTDIHDRKAAEAVAARQAAGFERLTAASAGLLAGRDPAGMAADLFAELGPHLGADLFFCFRYDPAADPPLVQVAAGGVGGDLRAAFAALRLGQDVCGRAAETGRRQYVPDLHLSPDPATARLKAAGVRAYVCAPLLFGGRLLGTLSFGSRTRDRFEADELNLLRTATHHFATALDRALAEERLRASEQRFRLAADAVNGIIYEYDPRTGHVERTRGLAEVLGYRPDEVPPTAAWWWEQTHPDDRTALERLTAAAESDRTVTEYRVRHRDGRWLHVEDRSVVLRDAADEVVRMVGCTVDVTDRKAAEVSVREQSALIRTITDNATTAIFMMDGHGRCTFMNPAAEQMIGFRFEEVGGRILHDLIHHHHPDGRPYPMPDCPIDRALPEQFDVVNHEDVFIRKNGEFFPVLVNAKPIRKGGAAVGTVIEVRDVTAEKRAAAANAGLVEQLRDADRRKDEFLATLAHELRNPLAPVRNAAQILMAKGPADPDQAWAGEVLGRQLRVMARLLDDLLDVSRISRGKLELRKERVELAAVVAAAVETSRPLIDAAGHDLAVALPAEPVELDADPVRLSQVLANLLNNAAKYTDRGGRLRLTAERAGDEVVVAVADDGIGIAPDVLPRLFEIFTQAEPALGRAQGGLGIGLSLVRGLVELHGGTIDAHSNGPGRGSTFTVRLPAAGGATLGPPAPAPEWRDASKCRLLIVDDLADSADSLARLLQLKGHEVRTAYGGEQAVALAGEFRPDVVLLDLGMPKVTGYDACRRIREQPWGRGMYLVALTGWGQDEDRRQTAAAGFDRHLVKPVDPDELEALLTSLAATPESGVAPNPVGVFASGTS